MILFIKSNNWLIIEGQCYRKPSTVEAKNVALSSSSISFESVDVFSCKSQVFQRVILYGNLIPIAIGIIVVNSNLYEINA